MRERLTGFTHDGLDFEVTDTGPLDGPVIVLLHGFPQTAASWSGVAAILNEAGYRTVAPDQRGYSPGARPRGRFAYRPAALVRDVLALVDRLGHGPVHLVGHDWGAAVAWWTAAARPARIATLTTVSVPHPGAFFRSLFTVDQLRRSYYMGLFQIPFLPERLLRARPGLLDAALARTGMPERTRAETRARVVEAGALPGGLNWYRGMLMAVPGGLGRRVRVPVTHVWSTGDAALGRYGADLAGRYAEGDYRLAVLEGVSHWVPDEAPEDLAALVLDRVATAR
ncbi:alpha/beta fold hydrolase [Nocardia thailandica]|uniref:Alpha/beta fold hydrolase n=1 Tax=Nocardia thailandica TaxID=257275 RepID=A0ABW6PW79_9NOCA